MCKTQLASLENFGSDFGSFLKGLGVDFPTNELSSCSAHAAPSRNCMGLSPPQSFSLAPQTLALLSVMCSPTNIAKHKLQVDVASELSVRAQPFPLVEQTKVDTIIQQGGAIAGTFHGQSRWSTFFISNRNVHSCCTKLSVQRYEGYYHTARNLHLSTISLLCRD